MQDKEMEFLSNFQFEIEQYYMLRELDKQIKEAIEEASCIAFCKTLKREN